MHTAWGTSTTYGGLGFYPGLEIRAKDGADVPFAHKEVDLVAMLGDVLILAECKESAEHLSNSKGASEFARQLGDLVELSDHLGASQLLVSSSTCFPDDKTTLLSEVPADRSVDIVWLDSRDLLDPNIVLHPLRHQTAAGWRADKPEGWANDYLDWVRRSVANKPA